MIELLNIDCMEYMKTQPDNAFDLAIVDPPYGLEDRLVIGGTWSVKYQAKGAAWDVPPSAEYFLEVNRVSQDWIIWGGNYFLHHLNGPRRSFIVWHKPYMDGMHTMGNCELAFTSHDQNPRVIQINRPSKENRIHVTQKPVKLYDWLLTNYAKPGQRILDTHLGSGSSAIAAYYFGVDFVGCEIDEDYYKAAKERFDNETRQETLAL